MSLVYQDSEVNQFILSDADRGLHPVRVVTDVLVPGQLRIELNYFGEVWTIVFRDIGDQSITDVVSSTDLVDLFDFAMIQNEIPDVRESDLLNCLTLLKDYFNIKSRGLDVAGWRPMNRFRPVSGQSYCLGAFDDQGALIRIELFERADDAWLKDGAPANTSGFSHWYDDVSGSLYARESS